MQYPSREPLRLRFLIGLAVSSAGLIVSSTVHLSHALASV